MTDFLYGWGVARKGKERVRVRERGEEGGAKKPKLPPYPPFKKFMIEAHPHTHTN